METPAVAPAELDPMQVRCREVEAWVASGSETGVEKAIAAAQAEPALKETAVRALGRTQSAKAAEYVASVLSDEDPAMVCAAIGAWAAMKGEAAIPDVAAILENNRNRSDGWQSDVGLACVMVLGEIRSSEALPVLEKEMKWVSQQQSKLGYGAALIEAVADIGDSRGAVMLEEYADELRGKLAGDPLIRRWQILLEEEALWKADELR
jgi:HEAT repeat protein